MKQIRALAAALLAAGLLSTATGCSFSGGEALYCLPDASEGYYDLQDAFSQVTDLGYDYLSPVSGSHQEPAELIDLTGDGTDEAVAFFSGSDGSVIACIFTEADGSYQLTAQLSLAGTGVNSAEYSDLDGNGTLELLLCCSVGDAAPQVLQVFSCDSGEALLEVVCSRYELMAPDETGMTDIICINSGATSAEAVRFSARSGSLTADGKLRLSGTLADLLQVACGTLADGKSALLVSFSEGDGLVTDVLTDVDSCFTAVTTADDSLHTPALDGTLLYPDDRTEDGLTEFPVLKALPAANTGATAQQLVCWEHLDSSGKMTRCSTVYTSPGSGWELTVPDIWADMICAQRNSIAEDDCLVGSVSFYRTDADGQAGEAQLTVYRIIGEGGQQYAEAQGLTVLYSDSDSLTAVWINDGAESWAGSMNLADVSANLRLTGSNET